jgi:hypothetical protein
MAIKSDQALSRSQVLNSIPDIDAATRYIYSTWGNATPDDVWDLLFHLGTVLGIVQSEIVKLKFQVPLVHQFTAKQLQAATTTVNQQWLALKTYFRPLNDKALHEHPHVATTQWIQSVRDPLVRGIYPGDPVQHTPFAAEPFVLLGTVLARGQDFSQRLADKGLAYHVFQEIRHRAKQLGDVVEETAEDIAGVVSWLPWVIGGAAALFLLTRR